LSLKLDHLCLLPIWKSRLQVAKMSTIPAKEIERNRDNPGGRNHRCAPPANHRHDGEEIYRFAAGDGT
jgi:hypothetical protein